MRSDPIAKSAVPSLDKAHYEKLGNFRYTLRRFLRFSEDAATRAGLPPNQHQALLAIHAMPGRDFATVGELSERLQILPNTALELAARLEEKGLLQRTRATSDRRIVHLSLTHTGLEKLRELSLAHREELIRLAPELTERLSNITREIE